MALLALWNPNIQFLKTDGTINAGGKLVVTDHNDAESVPANYSDADGTTLNSSPIVLDALGRATCYIDDRSTYDLYVKDANGATLWTVPEMTPGAETIVVRAGFSVSSNDSSVAVTISVDADGVTNYDLSIQDEIDRATAAEKAAKTEVVAGDNITVTKTVGAYGQDVYTISGEAGDNLVDDVRVNGASVVTDKVANIDVPVAGTASPLMDGAASAGASGKFAREDHVHPSDTSREAVANKTSVVQGSSDSKYPTDKAVWNFVNSSIATNTAYYISDNGEPFTSVADLEAYTGTVTNNDYAFVTGTDSEGNTYYDRYKATVRDLTVTWALEYRLNNSSFTAAQWAAINSGITAALAAKIHEHANKAVLDGITATDVSNWNNKLDKNGDGSDVTVAFTEAANRTNIATGSKLSVLFGQIRKWFTDLKSLAFKDKVGTGDVESGTYGIDISGNAATASSTERAVQTYALSIRGELNATYRKLGRLLTSYGGGRDVIMLVTSPDNLYGNIPSTYLVSVTNRLSNPKVRYISLGPLQNLSERMASFGYVRYDNNDIELAMFCPNFGSGIKVQLLISNAFTLDENFTSFDGTGYVVGDRYTNVSFLGSNAIGSSSIPTYVDANGVLQPCDPSSMSVGNAATASEAASGSTLESKINSKQNDLGISSSGSSDKFLNEQGEFVTITSPDVSGKADKVANATAGDVATLDANGNLVDSGKTLGTTVPADAAFTDDKVAQMKADSSDTAYPLLMAGTTDPRGNATVARYDSGVTLDPSTNTIAANISGNAASATTATTAALLGSATVGSMCMPIFLVGGAPQSIFGYFFEPTADAAVATLNSDKTLNAVGGGKYVFNVRTSNDFTITLASTASVPISFAVRLNIIAGCPSVAFSFMDAIEKTTTIKTFFTTSGRTLDLCFTYYAGYFHLVSVVDSYT